MTSFQVTSSSSTQRPYQISEILLQAKEMQSYSRHLGKNWSFHIQLLISISVNIKSLRRVCLLRVFPTKLLPLTGVTLIMVSSQRESPQHIPPKNKLSVIHLQRFSGLSYSIGPSRYLFLKNRILIECSFYLWVFLSFRPSLENTYLKDFISNKDFPRTCICVMSICSNAFSL